VIVADTDVLIDFLAGKGAARRVALELEAGALATTAVSRFELQAGTRSERQRTLVASLLEALPTLPLDARAADRAAEVRVRLDAQGRTIGMADSLIAGIVLAHGGLLLTRNLGHFERVEGLALARLSDEG
jgi:tRNA(fMet)-specific endonuclease VapC